MNRKQLENEGPTPTIQKPKVICTNKADRLGSKTAPIDNEFNFDLENEAENAEYVGSYNYYIYYHSIKPRDPRLPKPTYKPMPDMEFIKKGHKFDNEIQDHEDEGSVHTESVGKESGNNQKYYQDLVEDSGIDNMLNNLAITEKLGNSQTYDEFDKLNNPSKCQTTNSMGRSSAENIGGGVGGLQNSPYMQGIYQPQSQTQTQTQTQTQIDPYYQQKGYIQEMNYNVNTQGKSQGDTFPSQSRPYQGSYQSGNDYNNYYNIRSNQAEFNVNSQFPGFMGSNFINPYQNPNSSLYLPMQPYLNNDNSGYFFNNQGFSQMKGMYPVNNNMPNIPNMGNMYPMPNIGTMYPMNMPNMTNMSNTNLQYYNNMQNIYNSTYNMTLQQGDQTAYGGKNRQQNSNSYMVGQFPSNIQGNNNMYNPKKVLSQDSFNFNEVYANLIDLAKDHSGSRLVQKKYEDGTDQEKQMIFDKIFPEIYSLTKDVFGNYVIQKLLENSTPEKKNKIISKLEGKIQELTIHMYGCRVIQKAIEVAEEEDVRKHLYELKGHIKYCIEDQNGNHVIQKLIERLPQGEHSDILNVISGQAYELSTHQYGCRVIQRIFEYCLPEEKDLILEEIYQRILDLCQDQYGNYVIQHIIEKMDQEKIEPIFQEIKGNVFDLSIHKFASNAIEKCLAYGSQEQVKGIVDEILLKDDQTNDSLLAMVKDKYGNYVVQKMIESAGAKTKENIVKRIISSQALKKRDGFSKHVINFIEKMGFSAAILNNQIAGNYWK